MKDFKKIMLGMQAQSKTYLSRLYVDKFTKNPEGAAKTISGKRAMAGQGRECVVGGCFGGSLGKL